MASSPQLSCVGEAGQEIGEFRGGREMPGRNGSASIDGALRPVQRLDEGRDGLALRHPFRAHQNLHGLGVGVELALLLGALPLDCEAMVDAGS